MAAAAVCAAHSGLSARPNRQAWADAARRCGRRAADPGQPPVARGSCADTGQKKSRTDARRDEGIRWSAALDVTGQGTLRGFPTRIDDIPSSLARDLDPGTVHVLVLARTTFALDVIEQRSVEHHLRAGAFLLELRDLVFDLLQ